MTTETLTHEIFGDTMEINYDGNMWVSPCNGMQHSTQGEAMRMEIEKYYESCGNSTGDPDTREEIEQHVADFLAD